jgi:sugar lactone lactonase YvrE
MILETSTVEKVIAPPAAPEVLVEDAGKAAQNLCWDDRDESLWWTDSAGGRLYRLNLSTRIPSAVYEGPNVGAFLPQEDGSWLLFREKDIAQLSFDRHEQVVPLVENVRFDGDRFSEAIADETGRVLIGTVRNGRPNGAGLYRLDIDGTLVKIVGGTGQSAGVGWNEKGDALYWTCGTTRTINRFRYDPKRGGVTNRQVFHECPPEEGVPTALAMDVEGTLWSARRESGAILKIAPDRRLRGQVTFPAPHVTSLAFGGRDHRTVFASVATPEGGSKIFSFQSPVAGLPLRRARIEGRAPTPTKTQP